jgi:hypothetical protein
MTPTEFSESPDDQQEIRELESESEWTVADTRTSLERGGQSAVESR